jgi:NAD(P)-dependent dehydrogenase (short-subunit alcohol dehydrogenase family)
MKSFSGRVAVITGAGSGMGRALAERLASEGCHLALADLQAAPLAESAARALRAAAAAGHAVRCTHALVDVADLAAVEDFAAGVITEHGAVHLVFNNAGVSVTGLFEQLPLADFHWLMNINFWGVVHGCRAFLPHLHEMDQAHIVNTSSVFGLLAVPSQSAYHAAKFAVKGFTDALRLELQDTRIAVSCVMPGGVKTGIVRASRYRPVDNEAATREQLAAQFERYAALTPLAAADAILRGVRADRPHILVGRDAQFLARLVRLFPIGYYRVLAWLARRRGAADNRPPSQ